MKHIQKLRKLILAVGILAGMSLTAYAATAYTSGQIRISDMANGDIIKGTCTIYQNANRALEIYDTDGTTQLQQYNYGALQKLSALGYDTIVTKTGVGSGDYNNRLVKLQKLSPSPTVTSVTLDKNELSLDAGGATAELIATVEANYDAIKGVTWSSSDSTVASVNSNGVITPGGAGGPVTIKATSTWDNTKYAECTVTVTVVSVTGVSLNKTTTTLTVGGTETLTATFSPDDATDKSVTWSSSDTTVVTVENGVVTAVGSGTANITVTATNGTDDTSDDKTATCAVTVVSAATPISYITTSADPYNTGAYYATFYDSTTSYTADCEVYYATANADGRLTLQKAEGNVIKAGEGVILKATSETVTLTQTDAAASYDSLLIGSNTETTVENALVLSLGKNGVWFYKYSGTLGANKAYLAQ